MIRSKRVHIIVGAALVASLLAVPTATAAKPQGVIKTSNGYPSGAHWNLNIHGKDPGKFTADPTATGGSSVFVDLRGDSTLTLRSDNTSAVAELTALDPYAEVFDGDPAVVQIPYEAQGYYVFAAIRGKPNNGKDGGGSSVIMIPNTVPRASEYVADPTNPDALMLLGLVTTNGVYELTEAGLVRFASTTAKGKGKQQAVDITGLFMWTGWVVSATLDTSGPAGVPDGLIDAYDVPISYDDVLNGGNGNGVIDAAELGAWLTDMAEAGLATWHVNEWIFNIADVVEQDTTISNDGTKLLKLRFYPVDTTTFVR